MKDAKENLWNIAIMGIVICMVTAKSGVHIHSVLPFPYLPACVYNMALKRNNEREWMHKQICQEGGLHQSWCKELLHCDWLWKGVVSDRKVQRSLQILIGGIYNWYVPCWSSHHYHGLHWFNPTIEVIQQYVGMNNWENVIAFAGACKSWSVSTKTYCLKIGLEPMEGGGGRKLNVNGFLSYLDQEKFRVGWDSLCSMCEIWQTIVLWGEGKMPQNERINPQQVADDDWHHWIRGGGPEPSSMLLHINMTIQILMG